ncbi:hypothetical protein TWF106_003879 [Orbilia oligospora]|uniref:Uncharacterized protein n=1 Tax=Orbilia oligospora TaxID=2813651 RepID=A0A6G1MG63_ORBOL|nr:hypothetical protein TWF106_003879 [Orbilia oligospora]KAF3231815.1 hypothetical protein TWF191_003795 [Orbilia oligospora]KAF3255753.1 hypothetical protein TWF192_002194 [Orbilia oligospora]
MARKSNQKTKATGLASTTKFGKLDYEIYCHFKRAFAKWGGTADHTTSIRRVVERQKGSDDDTSLLVKKVGLRVVLQCLQKLLKAKAFCNSTEFTTVFPDVKWPADPKTGSKAEKVTAPTFPVMGDKARSILVSTTALGSTGSQAENSSSSPPESVKLSGVEDSVHAPRGRTGMSKSKRENRQDQVLRPSASRITKSKTKTTAPLRPRLPPNVPAVGNWDMGLLEPTTADGRTAADSQQDKPENGVASTVEPNRLSGTEQRQTVEVAILIAKKTFFAHLCCQEGATGIEDPLQVTMSRYKAEMSETVPEMRFDAFLQAENLAANHGQIEPLVLAQILSECQRDLDILGGYQFHGIMEEVKAKALTGAMYWIIEQKRELEE